MSPGGRKVPFSGKKKKEQLQEKRRLKELSPRVDEEGMPIIGRRRQEQTAGRPKQAKKSFGDKDGFESERNEKGGIGNDGDAKDGISSRPPPEKTSASKRYRLLFQKDIDITQEIEKAKRPIVKLSESEYAESMVLHVSEIHLPDTEKEPFPRRPKWDYGTTKEELESQEMYYFRKWVERMDTTYGERLGYYEHNLETWRQLWRVFELSDIILLITDSRYPILQFPPSVYKYVTEELGKSMVLILNKSDLVSSTCLDSSKNYFSSMYPNLKVANFTSFPSTSGLDNNSTSTGTETGAAGTGKLVLNSKRRTKKREVQGLKELLEACYECQIKRAGRKCTFEMWLDMTSNDINAQKNPQQSSEPLDQYVQMIHESEHRGAPDDKSLDKVVTLGAIGFTNVGKSSLLNGVLGTKFSSTSRTPGHTKHFQTIYLTPKVRLCDSPGIVFPSFANRTMQLLSGIFPIAQIRNPYTIVGYLAARVDLVSMLRIKHPALQYDPTQATNWSAWDICDGWAYKMGYHTGKGGKPDTYRAANHILRLCFDGKLPFFFFPPNYVDFAKARAEANMHLIELEHTLLNEGVAALAIVDDPKEDCSSEDESSLDDEDDDDDIVTPPPESESESDTGENGNDVNRTDRKHAGRAANRTGNNVNNPGLPPKRVAGLNPFAILDTSE